ncbi:MAG: insulinase family protein [Lachnospiraceae bacterium]|nr:insulinase family protein [Lachnospiraceae bacterium]
MDLKQYLKNGPYEELIHEELPDIHAEGYLLMHKKSGARVMLIPNADDNKVFNIAFRTPPADSTGVAHIIEHTVLCGSEEFPLKDPFVELVKGSLNTFLNAMTYPDKTMYPVASTNEADFKNLMHVYLDAVFHPNIYHEENIFRQEGWHYHLTDKEEALTLNGVVYNEMKGAFSSADEVLDRTVFNSLFPDTPYGVESGGDPEVIPTLTYENYLDFHRRYYHPVNSYIYLYGDMDMQETLAFIDEKYLAKYDRIPVSSEIPRQKPFEKMVRREDYYPISDEEDIAGNTYLTWNVVCGDPMNIKEMIAFDVIDYALFSAPGAPVRQALLDAGIGKDVSGSYNDGTLQPYFSMTARNAEAEDEEKFISLIRETLEKEVQKGINRESLLAGLNYLEFQFREADYSSYPKGLMYSIDVFDTWLYDEQAPFNALKQLDAYASLRKEIDEGYFEKLVQEKLLDNPFGSVVVLKPEKGLAKEREDRTAEKLSAIKSSFTEEELDAIIERTRALAAWQEEEESEEALNCLPMLSRSDIRREIRKLSNIEEIFRTGDASASPLIVWHDTVANGIGYTDLLWDLTRVPERLIPYLGVFRTLLGSVDTEHYSYLSLSNAINIETGGLNTGISVYDDYSGGQPYKAYFSVRMKALCDRIGAGFALIREIVAGSSFDDEKRVLEVLAASKAQMENSLQTGGSGTAMYRANAYFSPAAAFQEFTSGISYYRFLKDLTEHFAERKADLFAALRELMGLVFDPSKLTVSFTSDPEGHEILKAALPKVLEGFSKNEGPQYFVSPLGKRNEAFTTSGQVQYCAMCGSFGPCGSEYDGRMLILRHLLSYGYLWQNVRVKGGAYGVSAQFRRNGEGGFTSYRDPKLAETYDIFKSVPDYIQSFSADEKAMTRCIIGTMSGLDTPLTPSLFGMLSMRNYLSGISEQDSRKLRADILDASDADIRALADSVRSVTEAGYICVVGSESAVEKDKALFTHVEPLL